jgi:hypothetical protein
MNSREVGGCHRFEQLHPAYVQRLQQRERIRDVGRGRIRQRGPLCLVVELDGRPVFGQRPLEPHVAVDVRVGQVMHHLRECPTAVAIRREELRRRQSIHGLADESWSAFDFTNGRRTAFGGVLRGWRELSDRIAEVVHGTITRP